MSNKINIGIMGFGHIGRYIYESSLNSSLFQVKVISDIGNIDSLNYLLNNNLRNKKIGVSIKNESFVYNNEETKFVNGVSPGDINWNDYGVDWVVDATGKFLDKEILNKHIESGANKVILASLPNNDLDNLIIPGLNDSAINENDKIISAGSLLDMTTVFENDFENEEQINLCLDEFALKFPNFVRVVSDPIVSSDVIGMKESLVFDRLGTLKVGKNMVKTLAWYDNGYNHASRVLDVISLYEDLK